MSQEEVEQPPLPDLLASRKTKTMIDAPGTAFEELHSDGVVVFAWNFHPDNGGSMSGDLRATGGPTLGLPALVLAIRSMADMLAQSPDVGYQALGEQVGETVTFVEGSINAMREQLVEEGDGSGS